VQCKQNKQMASSFGYPVKVWNVASNIFVAAPIYASLLLPDGHVLTYILTGQGASSTLYHICDAVPVAQCPNLENDRLFDHFWAEFAPVMVGLIIFNFSSQTERNKAMLVWLLVHGFMHYMQMLTFLSMWGGVVVGSFSYPKAKHLHPGWMMLSSICGVAGLFFFYVDWMGTYYIYHGIWHFFAYMSEACAIMALVVPNNTVLDSSGIMSWLEEVWPSLYKKPITI